MLGGNIFSLWAGLHTKTPNGFTAPPLFPFAPHFSHQSSLFYFKTDESSEQQLKNSFLLFFLPLFMFQLLSQDTCAASHAHLCCPESQICQSHFTHLARQIAAPERVFWSVLMIYTVHLPTKMERQVLYLMCRNKATYIKTVWNV